MAVDVLIDTPALAARMRERILRPATREILIARLAGSDQEADLTVPPNAGGLGRIRHFQRGTAPGWPDNPLPIDPAAKSLGLAPGDIVRAQVFQNAACAWRCWYCYVPFELLGGRSSLGEWRTPANLVDLFANVPDRPHILDLTGGSPDLTPEWVVWTMEALEEAGLSDKVYLWSDDNLSTDYVFDKLVAADRIRLGTYQHYGRVCCFKGFDAESFAFNTGADASGFSLQFARFARYLELGIDLYGYVTLTGPDTQGVADKVHAFVDRLQEISWNLPLRVVPLRITPFGAMQLRRGAARGDPAFAVQEAAILAWNDALATRFTLGERARLITEVPL